MRNADRISAAVLIGICVYFWIEIRSFSGFGTLFPRVTVTILGLFSVLLFVMSFVGDKKHEKKQEGEGTRFVSIVLVVLLIVAWAVIIRVIGFVVTSFLFFSVITVVFERKKQKLSYYLIKIGTVGVTVAAFYLFFAKLLLVPFPRGALF